ncbi:hypothetical protein SOVF_098380 isoform B, partial [Spinacia oleracea]
LVSKVTRKIPAVKPFVRSRTISSLFSRSASTQDFRPLDKREDLNDDDSSREIEEPGKKFLDPEGHSPTKAPARCVPSRPRFRWKSLFKTWKNKSFRHLSSKTSVKKIRSIVGRNGDDVPVSRLSPINANVYKMKASWKVFSFCELQEATDNFSQENLIGKGGYADVHKGCLRGQLVAVKRLTTVTHEERITSFLSELGIIAHVDHRNTAKLIGYGVERGLYIVLELSSLGSLGSLLHRSSEILDWGTRTMRLSYFAPEYFMHGIVDEKTDVYAFGVLLLEIITGRKAFNCDRQSILLWAKPLLDEHDVEKLVDPVLGDDYDKEELDRLVLTAALCTQQSPVLRPRMNQVSTLLRGDNYFPNNSKGTQTQTLRRTYSEELLDAKEYNSTKIKLNDLYRHRQVAFDSIE